MIQKHLPQKRGMIPSPHLLFRKRTEMFTHFLLLFFLFFSTVTLAQNTRISGKVTDKKGVPIPGVNVKIKGSSAGSATDADGIYSLNASRGGSSLVFSFVGYTSKEVPINGRTTIDVQLDEETTSLNEVVVVGYGTQQKKDLTGAVSVVKAADIQKRQATTVAEAMQGLATGVNIRGGGQPGSEANILIRGLKNLSGTNPLYVIDGLISTANRDFNPNDIESIQILKDASAAAIYGSRAANGVIIITTKKGKEGPMRIDFSGKSSLQTIPTYNLAGTDEFARLNNMAYDNAGVSRQKLDLTTNTDWQKEAFRTGSVNDYNLTFSGGSKDGSYLVSANYFGNKGTVISTKFDRYSLRVNTSGTKGIFRIGENIAISNSRSDEMSGNPIIDVVRLLPTIPVYNKANPGGYGYGDEAKARTFGTNPVAIADLEDRTNENLRIRGNLFSELQFLPYLKYRLNLGYETSSDHYSYLRKQGNWTLNQAFDPAIANENRATSSTQLIENTLSFNKVFKKHSLNIVAGQSYQKDEYAQINGTKRNLLVNPTGGYFNVLDQGNEPQTGGFKTRSDLISYFGRFEYNYDDRYLLNGVVRRDGTSRFGFGNQWGSYPSVSGAWKISNEKFFNSSWINDLKVRASYGTLGSSNIGPYDYIPLVNTFSTIAMGRDQHIESGATQVQLANTNLHWEKLIQQNYGFDASFLNHKLSLTAEYFIARTEDVLFGFPIAMTTGNDGGNPRVNGITLGNKGFEFTATYREDAGDFKYYATANLTTLNNNVISLGYNRNNTYVGNTVTQVGQPVGMWYVLQTDGIFQNADEVNSYKNAKGVTIQPNAKPGDIRFKDNNGDGQITNSDKVVVGSPWPNYEIGLNLGASYKGFDFSMNWFGAFGATVFNGPRSVMDRFDDNSNYRAGIQPWTPDNPNTNVPRAYYGTTLNSRGDTDRWLENGSFMRLKFVSIAYNIPKAIVNKIGFANAQISVSGQNLLTFTKYTGLDPEFLNASIFEKGYDYGAFPNVRMYSMGLQFGF
ncbi:TonB-linked outer membrane protein, SusC/RagA family [Pseudarcicella hirudinis]|uniref:TonB-linked outer membrane protein, SusC/RagA family n=2 Tax=Pseudarcicella hirudinis TaxID=1079859 RepID=A0A1I5M107_9BACT|nr:TonB-linked outer membrane protein, SusC/RagA family [Pseudarcicella hirudinis]